MSMTNVAEDETLLLYSEVTEDHVKEALRADKGKSALLLSWEKEDFTKKGDNYIGIVIRLRVRYILDWTESQKTYVVKIIPHHQMKAYRDITDMGFEKEARFYSELAPALSAELVSVGQQPLRIPACYYTGLERKMEVIILEDLRCRGFKMYDRKKGMDIPHFTLVLKELARLHASSLLLQAKHGEKDLSTIYDFITKDWVTLNEESIKFSRGLFEGCIDSATAILNKVGGYEKAITWLTQLKPSIYKKVESQLKSCPPFTVICHGDCWNNNTLFRYNDEGEPIEVMLLDLQLMRRASLATDLNYLTYTSLTGPDRKEHIDDFLEIYYDTFTCVLKAGDLAIPFTPEELHQEYKKKGLYGIISSLEIVPIVVSETSEVPDYSSICEDGLDTFVKQQQNNMLQMIEQNPLLRPRFLAIFDDIPDTT